MSSDILKGCIVTHDSIFAKNCKYIVKSIYSKYGITWYKISIRGKRSIPPYLVSCEARKESLSLDKDVKHVSPAT